MSSKNEIKLVSVLAIVCLVVGVFCYTSLSAKSPESPVRLMFENLGGNVLFDHQTHSNAYGLECEKCHHAGEGTGAETAACSSCHTADPKIVTAFGENASFDHEAHAYDLGLACNDCHHNYSEEDGGSPQPCSDCHEPGVEDDFMLGRAQAFHKQCIGCHENFGVMPGQNDCGVCHSPRKRTDAFHEQCIGCHEDFGAGPAGGDSDCKKCHGF